MNSQRSSLYRPIDSASLEAARKGRFAGPPARGEEWKIRHCLPVDAEAYCALILPWKAFVEGPSGWLRVREECFDGIAEAYDYMRLPMPDRLTLDAWHADFRMLEDTRAIPPLALAALDRFSNGSKSIFVQCHHGEDVHNWEIERNLFLSLEDPFAEMPQPFGTIEVFPGGAPWFLLNRDDEPVIYVAGPSGLISTLDQSCPGRVISLQLEDRYY